MQQIHISVIGGERVRPAADPEVWNCLSQTSSAICCPANVELKMSENMSQSHADVYFKHPTLG